MPQALSDRRRAAAAPTPTVPCAGQEQLCADPLSGLLVGERYRIEEAIGKGGYGAVYRARHTETGGLVAVKFLCSEIRLHKSAVRRFYLEAQNAAALSHPNTIRVTDFGADGNLLFYAMEYLEGRSLADLLSDPGRLHWRRGLRIIAQTLSALCAAHEHPRRIVHRDVKPANIMVLNPPGHADFVKVIDFGIARALEATLTSTRGVAGTPRYMAPEQWEGGATDARTDLYALGCLLYEMLAGVPPFVSAGGPGSYVEDLRWMHRNVVPAPLRGRVDDDLPAGVLRLTQQLMAKRPVLRPRSAREALDLLGRAERGETLDESCTVDAVKPMPIGEAREPSTIDPPRPSCTSTTAGEPERASRTRSRLRLALLSSLLVFGAASALIGFGGDEPAPTSSARAPARLATPRPRPATPGGERVGEAAARVESDPRVAPAGEPAAPILDLSVAAPEQGSRKMDARGDREQARPRAPVQPRRKRVVKRSTPSADQDLPPRRLGGRALGF